MLRVEEITIEQANYLKQASLGPAQLAELGRVRESKERAFAGHRAWQAERRLPVLRLEEAAGCNYQISDVIALADEQGRPLAVLAIDDKWIDAGTGPGTIYFGGKVHFF